MAWDEKTKLNYLKQLGTADAISKGENQIKNLAALLEEREEYYTENASFYAPRGQDCPAIKEWEAEKLLTIPDEVNGKKLSNDKLREAWLIKQKNGQDYKQLLKKQLEVQASLAGYDAEIQAARNTINLHFAFLQLRAAQILLLAK